MGSETFKTDCRECVEMFRDMGGCFMDENMAKALIPFGCDHCGDIFNSAMCDGNTHKKFFYQFFFLLHKMGCFI